MIREAIHGTIRIARSRSSAMGRAWLCGLVAGLLAVVPAAPAQAGTLYTQDGRLVGCVDDDTLAARPCTEAERFSLEGRVPVAAAFRNGKFDELDRLLEQWCRGTDRFADGRWKLSMFEEGLVGELEGVPNWEKNLARVQAWRQAAPGSMAGMLTEAIFWKAYAWKARGSGPRGTVTPEAMQVFGTRMVRAADAAARAAAADEDCPVAIPVLLKVATAMGAPEPMMQQIYAGAAERFPEYHAIHFAMAQHYQPQWGGSVEAYDRFAREVAASTRAFEGMGLYARLYWIVDHASGIPFGDRDPHGPSWQDLRAGFEDLMKRYPRSMHNRAEFASMACRSPDGALYRSLRDGLDAEATAGWIVSTDACDRRHAPAGGGGNAGPGMRSRTIIEKRV